MMPRHRWSFLFLLAPLFSFAQDTVVFLGQNGTVKFRSYAPLEIIQASSDKLQSVIDVEKNTFAFRLEIASFEGFNSPLQQVHFNENYMESKQFQAATFSGKIIEKLDWSKPGEYTIRAKGELTVHGVSRERIIKSTVIVGSEGIFLNAHFSMLLDEHDIDIPKIVHQKIAEEVTIEVTAQLTRNKS